MANQDVPQELQWFHWNQIWLLTYIISDEFGIISNYFVIKMISLICGIVWFCLDTKLASVVLVDPTSLSFVVATFKYVTSIAFPEFPRFKTALIWIQWLWSQLYRCLFADLLMPLPHNVHNYSNRFIWCLRFCAIALVSNLINILAVLSFQWISTISIR
jgi:hypothetical protein